MLLDAETTVYAHAVHSLNIFAQIPYESQSKAL